MTTRQHKIEWVKAAITEFFKKNPKGKISAERFLAEFSLFFGSTERTGKEILKILEKTKFIKINGDEISK